MINIPIHRGAVSFGANPTCVTSVASVRASPRPSSRLEELKGFGRGSVVGSGVAMHTDYDDGGEVGLGRMVDPL